MEYVSRCNQSYLFIACWAYPNITSFIWCRVGEAPWTCPDITSFIWCRAGVACCTCPDVTSFIWGTAGVACWMCPDKTSFIWFRVGVACWTCPLQPRRGQVEATSTSITTRTGPSPGREEAKAVHQTKPSTNIDQS